MTENAPPLGKVPFTLRHGTALAGILLIRFEASTGLSPLPRPLLLSDALFAAYLVAIVLRIATAARAPYVGRVEFAGVFLAVVLLNTSLLHGASAYGPGRLMLYIAVGIAVSQDGLPERVRSLVLCAGLLQGLGGCLALLEGARFYGWLIDDPHQTGLLLLAALAAETTRRNSRALVIALLLAGIWSTMTRTIWAAAILVIASEIGRVRTARRQVIITAITVGVAASTYSFVTRSAGLASNSASFRESTLRSGIDAFRREPLLGHGWDFQVQTGGVPYNAVLQVSVAGGVLATIGLLWWWFEATRRTMATCGWASRYIACFIAVSLTEPSVYAESIGFILLCICACLGHEGPHPATDAHESNAKRRTSQAHPLRSRLPAQQSPIPLPIDAIATSAERRESHFRAGSRGSSGH